MTIREKAFRLIQNTPHLYRAWNDAKTESERTDMLIDIAYSYGVDDGRTEMEAARNDYELEMC